MCVVVIRNKTKIKQIRKQIIFKKYFVNIENTIMESERIFDKILTKLKDGQQLTAMEKNKIEERMFTLEELSTKLPKATLVFGTYNDVLNWKKRSMEFAHLDFNYEAITIHQSQGATIGPAFTYIYVYDQNHCDSLVWMALSRATSLENLFILVKSTDGDLNASPEDAVRVFFH